MAGGEIREVEGLGAVQGGSAGWAPGSRRTRGGGHSAKAVGQLQNSAPFGPCLSQLRSWGWGGASLASRTRERARFPSSLTCCWPLCHRASLEETAATAQARSACSSRKPRTYCSTTTPSAWPDSRADRPTSSTWGRSTSRRWPTSGSAPPPVSAPEVASPKPARQAKVGAGGPSGSGEEDEH